MELHQHERLLLVQWQLVLGSVRLSCPSVAPQVGDQAPWATTWFALPSAKDVT